MTILQLKTLIADLPDEMEILCQAGNNDLGTVWNPRAAGETTYSFFGHPIPCFLIEHTPKSTVPLRPEDWPDYKPV